MSVRDFLFPYIEPLGDKERERQDQIKREDIAAIRDARFLEHEDLALSEAQRVANSEAERVRTAETKASIYIGALMALVPLILALLSANWSEASGPAPIWLKLVFLVIALLYLGGAGMHALKAIKVTGYERVQEREVVEAWLAPRPRAKLAKSTLLASRRSRDTVNAKVTEIRVTHAHIIRAFIAFAALISLDPIFYVIGSEEEELEAPAAQQGAGSDVDDGISDTVPDIREEGELVEEPLQCTGDGSGASTECETLMIDDSGESPREGLEDAQAAEASD